MTGSRKGYTLIELMITVAIIGILAASVRVIFANFFERSLEGATKANLGTIMAAVSVYYSDNPGKWPQDPSAASFKTYLPSVPAVKVTHKWAGSPNYVLSGTSTSVSLISSAVAFSTATDGWRYNYTNGWIWVNNSQTDTTGVSYSLYGY